MPSPDDFLVAFGIEPYRTVADRGLTFYRFPRDTNGCEAELSFSSVENSLEIRVLLSGTIVSHFVSEGMCKLSINDNINGSWISAEFDYGGARGSMELRANPVFNIKLFFLKSD